MFPQRKFPNRQLLTFFLTLNIFFVALFRFAGVGLGESIAVLAVASLQIVVGGFVWLRICNQKTIDTIEFVGMGGALGFGLSLLSSQIFRTTLPFLISWLILPIAVLFALIFSTDKNRHKQVAVTTDLGNLFLILSGTLISLSTSWYWLVSTATAAFFLSILYFIRKSNQVVGKEQSKWQSGLLFVGIYASVQAFRHLSSLSDIRNPLWWNLRFGVMQDPDVIFAESMINSVQQFGAQGNIFFVGLRFYYHWFSFAWQATLGSLFELKPFVVTAIAAPAIILFIILSLTFTIARRLSSSLFSAPVAMFSVAMLCAGPIPFLRVLHPYSLSFNFGLIFLYSLVVIVMSCHEMKRSHLVSAIFVLSLCLIGSKVSFGPMLVVGLGMCFAWALFSKKFREISVLLSISGALAVLVCFTFIYKIGTGSGSNYQFSFGEILRQKANLEDGLPAFVVIFTFVCVLAYLLASTFGLVFVKNVIVDQNRLGIIFVVSGGIIGIVLGFVLSDPTETGAYFIQGGLALLVPLSVALIFHNHQRLENRFRFFMFVAIALCLEGARRWPDIYERNTFEGVSRYITLALAISLPVLVSVVCVLVSFLLRRFIINVNYLRLLAILLLVSTAGSYFANAGKFSDRGVWSAQNISFAPEEIISGSNQYRNILTSLVRLSGPKDIVATNRYCTISTESAPDCRALWNLTSAITGRQMLIEGQWSTNIISGLEDEAENRRSLIENFVNSPTVEGREALLAYGVRWVVADHAVTTTRDWGNFATIRFKNKAGAILELVP